MRYRTTIILIICYCILEWIILDTIVLTVTVLLIYTLEWILFARGKNLPPGPWGLPIFGQSYFLESKCLNESLADIAHHYGPVCSLWIRSQFIVLITDPKIMRKAFAEDEITGIAPYFIRKYWKGYGTRYGKMAEHPLIKRFVQK